MKGRLDVICGNCGQVFYETTDRYHAEVKPVGAMVRLKPKYQSYGWSMLAPDASGDNLCCTSCACTLTVAGQLWTMEPGAQVKPPRPKPLAKPLYMNLDEWREANGIGPRTLEELNQDIIDKAFPPEQADEREIPVEPQPAKAPPEPEPQVEDKDAEEGPEPQKPMTAHELSRQLGRTVEPKRGRRGRPKKK